jgi:hypothetical protein
MFYIEHWRTYLDTRKKAKQMKKKWEYFKEDTYLDIKLREIREEYGIYL